MVAHGRPLLECGSHCPSGNCAGPFMATPEQWLGKLANLKVDKARGDAAPNTVTCAHLRSSQPASCPATTPKTFQMVA
jgi:hypothetical protein